MGACSRSPQNTAAEQDPGPGPALEAGSGSVSRRLLTPDPRAGLRPCWGRQVALQPHPPPSPSLSLPGGLHSFHWCWDYTHVASRNRTWPCALAPVIVLKDTKARGKEVMSPMSQVAIKGAERPTPF